MSAAGNLDTHAALRNLTRQAEGLWQEKAAE